MATSNIQVIVRFRPVNDREIKEDGVGNAVKLNAHLEFGDTQVKIVYDDSNEVQAYTFDRVFWNQKKTSQQDVYDVTARETIKDVCSGYNGTIFAYGQTGTGKSFTMFGPNMATDLKGIIPRSCVDIFKFIANAPQDSEYTVKCSFLEIYNENLRDLLNPKGQPLKIRENKDGSIWIENLTQQPVNSEPDVLQLIQTGEKHRTVSSTQMNEASSRSHSLFILNMSQKLPDGSIKTGYLNLVDLAGSESVGKTGATGVTLEEAKKINQSLSALGNCIYSLSQKKKGHVPYRNSKLTHILRESLGGNCKTTLLIACSPHRFNIEETISTLKFGHRAKKLKNEVKQNKVQSVDEMAKTITTTTNELNELKEYVRMMESQMSKTYRIEPSQLKEMIATAQLPVSPPQERSEEVQLEKAESELNELKDLKDSSQARLMQLNQQIDQLGRQDSQNRSEIERLEFKLKKEQGEVKNLNIEIEVKEIEVRKLEEKIHQAALDAENRERLLQETQSKNKEMELELKRFRELTKMEDERRKEILREKRELEELKKKNKELEEELRRVKANPKAPKVVTIEEVRQDSWKSNLEGAKRSNRANSIVQFKSINSQLRAQLEEIKKEEVETASQEGNAEAPKAPRSRADTKSQVESQVEVQVEVPKIVPKGINMSVNELESRYLECIHLCKEYLATTPGNSIFIKDLQMTSEEEQKRRKNTTLPKDPPGSPEASETADPQEESAVHLYLANCFMTLGNISKAKKMFDSAQNYYSIASQHYVASFKLKEQFKTEAEQIESRDSAKLRSLQRKRAQTLDKVQNILAGIPATVDSDEISSELSSGAQDSPAAVGNLTVPMWKKWKNWVNSDSRSQLSRSQEVKISESPTSPVSSPPVTPRSSNYNSAEDSAKLQTALDNLVATSQVEEDVTSPGGTRRGLNREKSQTFHRGSVIREIVVSERDYVNDLTLIVEIFIQPLRLRKIISDREISEIFSNLETIVKMNVEVLTLLEDRLKTSQGNFDAHNVGDIFLQMGDYLKMYKVYCANQGYASQKVQNLSNSNSQFKQFLKDCGEDPRTRKLPLNGYLIKPVQRICKYPLLFKELVRHTPETHGDHARLVSARNKIEEIVTYVNEGQRLFESQQRILSIQNSIDGIVDLVAPSRILIKEGILSVQLSSHDKTTDHLTYLFNDLVIFAKKKDLKIITSKDSNFVAAIPMGCVVVALLQNSDEKEKKSYKFVLDVSSRPNQKSDKDIKSMTLSCPDEKECQSWFEAFVGAAEEFQQKALQRRSMVISKLSP
eukprot:TRINITY_DN246_c0_g3_i1.p1 TRINITY_DN246_c0_g3~~TRINITY_DN246_c0_g3_i1.p1  ORF type:complete len:1281 (+),score=503.97 TRINITY_DN246_c0_g3_i1:73-3915(+)